MTYVSFSNIYITSNRKISCDFPKPQGKARPESAMGVGMRWTISLSICFLLFSSSPAPPLLLPSSSPYHFSPSPLSPIGGYYISQSIHLASITEIVCPFVSLLCISVEEDDLGRCSMWPSRAQAPLTLLILISKGCCSCLHWQRWSRQGNLVLVDSKVGKKRECDSFHVYLPSLTKIYSHGYHGYTGSREMQFSLSGLVLPAPASVAIVAVGNNQQPLCEWFGFIHGVRKGEEKMKWRKSLLLALEESCGGENCFLGFCKNIRAFLTFLPRQGTLWAVRGPFKMAKMLNYFCLFYLLH